MKNSGLLAAVLAAAAAAGVQVAPNQGGASAREARQAAVERLLADQQRLAGVSAIERAMRLAYGGAGGPLGGGYRNRAGWSTRRYQRHAQKLRNRARHRQACKGRRHG